MLNKILGSWLFQLFCVLWGAFLLMDYINASHYFINAYSHFHYWGMLIVYGLIVSGLVYLFGKRVKPGYKIEIKNFRNIYHYALLLLTMAVIMLAYMLKVDLVQNPGGAVFVFVFRTLFYHFGIILIFVAAYSLGNFILSKLPFIPSKPVFHFTSFAIGLLVLTLILFLIGAVGLMNKFVLFPVMIGAIALNWRSCLSVLKELFISKMKPVKVSIFTIVSYSIVILIAALNLVYVSRPYPVGFDDLNLYMNIPKLIDGYGGLVHGGDAYNWSIIMSLGFVMYNSPTISMLLSIVPGILTVLVVYSMCRYFNLSRNWSMLALLLVYTIPVILWQSRSEAKVDLALLFITLVVVFQIFAGFVENLKSKKKLSLPGWMDKTTLLWMVNGLLMGFAFGIKYTSMFYIFALFVAVFYISGGKWSAIGMFFLNFFIIFFSGLHKYAFFEIRDIYFLWMIPLIISVLLFAVGFFKNRQGFISGVKYCIVFGFAIGLVFIPWAIKNVKENGKISFGTILNGKSSQPLNIQDQGSPLGSSGITPLFKNANEQSYTYSELGSVFSMPFKLFTKSDQGNDSGSNSEKQDQKVVDLNYQNTAKYEEIRRYLGYEDGLIKFVSLPYDIIMKTNVRLWSADFGVLIVIFIPLLMFVYTIRSFHWNLLRMLLMLFVLILSVASVSIYRGYADYEDLFAAVSNEYLYTDGFYFSFIQPVYIEMKRLIIIWGLYLADVYNFFSSQRFITLFIIMPFISLPVYMVYRERLKKQTPELKAIVLITFAVLNYWIVLSSGIVWYGLLGFVLFPVILSLMVTKDREETYNGYPFFSKFIFTVTGIWITLILPFQFMPVKYMTSPDLSKENLDYFIEPMFAKFAVGAQDEKAVFRQFFSPMEQNIINTLNRDDKSVIINVTTFYAYHIKNNDRRVYNDNQLGVLGGLLDEAEGDRSEFIEKLKGYNVKYLLIGLNTNDIDMTPDKSLSKKFNRLMETLVNNPRARLLFTNRLVERPDGDLQLNVNGRRVIAKYDLAGYSVIDQGKVALFELR